MTTPTSGELDNLEADQDRLDLLEQMLADGQLITMQFVEPIHCLGDSEKEVVMAVGCTCVLAKNVREALDKIAKL
jgi:hypothetical protein